MSKGNLKVLGQKIKKARKQKGLLQVDLAVRVGISSGYVGSIEQGLRFPSLKVLQKIAKTLGIDVKELF